MDTQTLPTTLVWVSDYGAKSVEDMTRDELVTALKQAAQEIEAFRERQLHSDRRFGDLLRRMVGR